MPNLSPDLSCHIKKLPLILFILISFFGFAIVRYFHQDVIVPEDGRDSRWWAPSKNGSFVVASFAEVLSYNISYPRQLNPLWELKAPPRVLLFGWLAMRGSILTMDNLRRHNMIITNACPLFLIAEETMDYIMLNYMMFQKVWNSIITNFGCSWVMPRGIGELFQQ